MKSAAVCILGIMFAIAARKTLFNLLELVTGALAFVLILNPICSKLEKHGMAPVFSVPVSIILMLLGAAVVGGLLLPYMIAASRELIITIAPTLADAALFVDELLGRAGIRILSGGGIPEWMLGGFASLSAGLAQGGMWVFRKTGSVVMSLAAAFYLLKERRRFACYTLLAVPMRRRIMILETLNGCRQAVCSYLSGVVKTGAFVAAAMLAGLTVLGIQDAPLLALLMGIFEIFPYFGPILASAPILLVALSDGMGTVLACAALIVIVQQTEANIAGPMLTASSTSVHPLVSLLAVYTGGSLFGIPGILLAIPVIVVARSAVWTFVAAQEDESSKTIET